MDTFILETRSEVKLNSDPEMVLTLSSQDASKHQKFGFLPQIM